MAKICVLGAGSWGTALAALLAKNDNEVVLWGRVEDGVELIAQQRQNNKYLPGITIPEAVTPMSDIAMAMEGAEWVVLSIPSQALRSVLEVAQRYLVPQQIIVNTAKGLEISSGMRMSQVTETVLGGAVRDRYAVLSGPSHAEEVAREIPTAVTVAACRQAVAAQVQDLFMSSNFRVYTNPDVAGVELGGSLKNIIALATGVAYGLGYGDNTMAALLTRGLTEIIRMGAALGGNPRTFSGLSGIGDLVVTCGSRHSRNRLAGELIGQGLSLEAALQKVGMAVEGAPTCRIVHKIAETRHIDMPITRACYQVLFENRDPREAVGNLMQRHKKHETEEIVDMSTGW
ncbi:MAG: NAD(P)H-dependent glycerol-3-phosphate dehydrogenase [Firmicutes bacterium]|nr:NAD(P)H-dependent glycerol-3-phosphate dehydrogenase [Bacillota bacterium]